MSNQTIAPARVALRNDQAAAIRPLGEGDRAALLAFGRNLPQDDLLYLEDDFQSHEIISRLVNAHQAKLYNVTDTADTLIGTPEFAPSGATVMTSSIITGRFTIAAQKVFEVQHQCGTTRATDGLGNAANFGVTEIYTIARFWKTG